MILFYGHLLQLLGLRYDWPGREQWLNVEEQLLEKGSF